MDGNQIPIKRRPQANSQDYFSYKMFHSINVQAVCDSQGRFVDIDCHWPGSVHDAKIFSNSNIRSSIACNFLPITFRLLIPGTAKVPNFLIGDPAYPLTPYCLKEYDYCTNDEEVIFNNLLRKARNPIECAFGSLKNRWPILTKKIDIKLENIPKVIYTCFILHNFYETRDDAFNLVEIKSQIAEISNNISRNNGPDNIYSANSEKGVLVRKVITNYVIDCSTDCLKCMGYHKPMMVIAARACCIKLYNIMLTLL